MTTALKQPRKSTKGANFRVDLQGLRALAVLLVMSYHIWFSKVSGGVDIFLMLSAFSSPHPPLAEFLAVNARHSLLDGCTGSPD
ncbi:hypothetical protein [Glutamicibacter sp. M10]|uniref:hypothetical protein n=1 Tax=Glutamicibacter sp. M10 TaxID=3023076 RepID=UPI0021C88D8B|nr:hypothetical protein [Glutamicibacter sp. M10]UXN33602.1 hypothetical protein N6V40_08355 [Glutamicibacter sp. M10]